MSIPRLSRLSAILTTLQSKRIVTATELAKKYEVSIRTIYRDIKALEESGIPICTEEGKGYSLLEGYNLPPVQFSEEEANAFITAQKFIITNSDTSFVQNYLSGIEKIKAVLRYSQKDKVNLLENRTYLFSRKKDNSSNHLSLIQKAITNYTLLKIEYHSLSKDEFTERTIEPLAVYSTRERWIVIAFCRSRQANREFRLDRIKSLRLLSEIFDPKPFDLKTYFVNNIP